MQIQYPHNLKKEEAYRRISNLLPKLQEQYKDDITDPVSEWNEDHTRMKFSLGIRGVDVAGEVRLEDNEVIMEADLPLVARIFSDKIEGLITGKLDELLA